MNTIRDRRGDAVYPDTPLAEPAVSAVSWGAILAGGVGAAAFALILLALGSGLGLASINPWAPARESAARFGFAAIVWICVTQILSSGLGGYIAGRLRTRWLTIHVDEAHFRDTVHGFLSWAVATLVSAAFLSAAVGGLFSEGTKIASESMSGVMENSSLQRGNASAADNAWPVGYLVDGLFRKPASTTAAAPAAASTTDATTAAPMPVAHDDTHAKQEVERIFFNSLSVGAPLPNEDTQYVAQLVARHTGISQEAAQARVTTTYSQLQQKLADLTAAAKQAADKARKAGIFVALWLFIALLMGAFSASFLATHGGRQRDL